MAESMACMPDAQLRITVQPGTFFPQPRRSATMRPILVSSGDGAAQLTIQELGSMLRADHDRWGPIVKTIGFTADS